MNEFQQDEPDRIPTLKIDEETQRLQCESKTNRTKQRAKPNIALALQPLGLLVDLQCGDGDRALPAESR